MKILYESQLNELNNEKKINIGLKKSFEDSKQNLNKQIKDKEMEIEKLKEKNKYDIDEYELYKLYGTINEKESLLINKEKELDDYKEQLVIKEKELENFNILCKIIVSEYQPKNDNQKRALNEIIELIK